MNNFIIGKVQPGGFPAGSQPYLKQKVFVPMDNTVPQREMTGVELISAERDKQLRIYGPKHDDGYLDCVLVRVAIDLLNQTPDMWNLYYNHISSRVDQLVIAGALIAAEIDRIKRMPR